MLAKPDAAVIQKALKENEWNDYEIRAEGPRMVLKLNGVTTVDYTEKDASIPLHGLIAVQIHGGGKTVVLFKDITMKTCPEGPGSEGVWRETDGHDAAGLDHVEA